MSNRIRELRETRMAEAKDASLWTQKALAFRIGASLRSMSAWENGLNLPRGYFRKRLAKALGVTEAELFNEHQMDSRNS